MITFEEMEDVARTAYNVYGTVLGEELPAWDGRALEDQAPWLRLAKKSETILEQCEGQGYSEAGRRLFVCYMKAVTEDDCDLLFGNLQPRHQLAWEAVARHLVQLLDAGDELEDGELPDLEKSWGPWAERRLASAHSGRTT